MAAAYGLYTHIRANRRRSIFLLLGLFFLIYLMTFSGALVAEGLIRGDQPLDEIIREAWRDFLMAWPIATAQATAPPQSCATRTNFALL